MDLKADADATVGRVWHTMGRCATVVQVQRECGGDATEGERLQS